MALSIGRELQSGLRRRRLPADLFIGGRLTEDLNGAKSVDVTSDLAQLGAVPCARVEEMVARLARKANQQGG
jgi:hypothetical protein